MSWLFSLYALGGLAVVGPILFHMWRRRPRGERPFSTLMFLTVSPPKITSRSRIEHWLLLALRASALGLLAFAFMRPLWRAPLVESDPRSDEQLIAVLVDTSASMRRDGIWDDLIRQLDERLSKSPANNTIGLYAFHRDLQPIADFSELRALGPAERMEVVRARLKELKPTWYDTRLGDALVQAASAIQEAQSERSKPVAQRIWLASDLQMGSETVALQGYEWPDDLPVEIIQVKPTSPSNAGLQLIEKNADSPDDLLRVRITNSSDSTKEKFTLGWDNPASTELSIYVPPGQSRVVTPPKRPDGYAVTSVILKGDDHDFDNRVYLAESTPETRLAVYCGPESSNDTDGPRFYLDRVFSASMRFPIELKESREVNLASADSIPSLVILIQSDPQCQSLVKRQLENGGTVLIASPNPESMQASLALCGREAINVTEATVNRYAMLGEIDFQHPVFAPFAESQFSDFTGIRFWKHRTLAGLIPRNAEEGSEQSSADRVLARFDDGDPAVIDLKMERGRVLVFAAGWQPADSQFARSSKFPMLMLRLIEQASGYRPRSDHLTVGDQISWPSTARIEAGLKGSVLKPDQSKVDGQSLDLPFSDSAQPGVYTLSVPGRVEKVAVNIAPDESRTAPLTLEQLESFGLKLKSHERAIDLQRATAQQRQLQLMELEQQQKLWQIVLCAVVAILLIETILGGWLTTRQSLDVSEATPGVTA